IWCIFLCVKGYGLRVKVGGVGVVSPSTNLLRDCKNGVGAFKGQIGKGEERVGKWGLIKKFGNVGGIC
ncbi:MAG: hypothetical protein K2L22_04835, partial [Muribaculaceae bacterium]|nr:hypothetical protein [Muribaculaceae bacterium]